MEDSVLERIADDQTLLTVFFEKPIPFPREEVKEDSGSNTRYVHLHFLEGVLLSDYSDSFLEFNIFEEQSNGLYRVSDLVGHVVVPRSNIACISLYEVFSDV